MEEKFILEILKDLTPKIKSVLYQTSPANREDLEQEIKLMIIKKTKEDNFNDTPSLFELLSSYEEQGRSTNGDT